MYIRSPVGIKGLARIYGGQKNNGTRPSHFQEGSHSVARKCVQALEGLKIVEKDANEWDMDFELYIDTRTFVHRFSQLVEYLLARVVLHLW